MAKQLSVQEILAAARAEKAKAAGASAPASPESAAPESTAPETPVAEPVSPAEPAPAAKAPAAKVVPGGKGMSMADILAAARAKPGAAAAVTERPAKPAV